MADKLNLSAPWITYVQEVKALFKKDPEVRVEYDEDETYLKLFVENPHKADALTKILPVEKTFGNVILTIDVIPANVEESLSQTYKAAFEGNRAFNYLETVEGIFTNPISYVVFANEVVQFFNDDLNDIHGLKSTLYEDIARDVFEKKDGMCFCTDLPDEEISF